MRELVLGIETSCDETALAIVEAKGGFIHPRFRVFQNLVSSQIKIHRRFGGVVPLLAKREHQKNLPILFKKIARQRVLLKKINLLAVTVGPGLEPALWSGIDFAKEIRKKLLPWAKLIGVNHLEGHLYSFLLPGKIGIFDSRSPISRKNFPAVVLIVSGGHTILLKMDSLKEWKKLGETRDDAAGEAFDKVGRMLDLPYPGGPEIEKLARKGNPQAINFPRPMINQKNYDFSFSGLKTSVFYLLRDKFPLLNIKPRDGERIRKSVKNPLATDIAASFQEAVIDVLAQKTMKASREYGAESIVLCGGVAANASLRREIEQAAKNLGIQFFAPEMKYNLDNAAMIAAAGYFTRLRRKNYPLRANGAFSI